MKILPAILLVMSMVALASPILAQTEPGSGSEVSGEELVLGGPVVAQAEQPPGPGARRKEAPLALKIVDVVLVRPVCVVGSTISTAAYLLISPVAYVTGVADPAARAMVEAPWRFTAYRYVGQFDHYRDERPASGVWEMNY